MKTKVLSLFLFVFLLSSNFIADATDIGSGNASETYLAVYYFHGNFRCMNCHKIENYTKETIEKYFSEQLRKGKIVYKTVNVEKKENAHFVEEYGLYTRSVVLSLVKNGEEDKYKNLIKVWEYLGNKAGFEDYEKKEIEEFLKEL